MKSTLFGLVAAIIIGAIGLIVLRSTGALRFPNSGASPSPSASVSPNFEFAPVGSAIPSASPAPSVSPEPSAKAATKGGVVLGEDGAPTVRPSATPRPRTTTTTTTTTSTTVTSINLFYTKSCPVDGTAYLRGIQGPITIKYSVKDGYSAKVTIWKTNGETILNQTQVSGSGVLKTIDTRDDLKFQVVSHECKDTSDTWLKLTAEK